ncbi:unnamed protein product [Amoebophrya sp. A120]|nr:unnamed protein product [Amoebophrya sp. A120]|eukprot:GSA120T00009976001.1
MARDVEVDIIIQHEFFISVRLFCTYLFQKMELACNGKINSIRNIKPKS